jgi:hypothetical protein
LQKSKDSVYETSLSKKDKKPNTKGAVFINADILNKAKNLTDNRIIVSQDDFTRMKNLAYDSTTDDQYMENKQIKQNKSDNYRTKIKEIDAINRESNVKQPEKKEKAN